MCVELKDKNESNLSETKPSTTIDVKFVLTLTGEA